MKSLSKIVSEVELLSEAVRNKKTARKQQVDKNKKQTAPRWKFNGKTINIPHPKTGVVVTLRQIQLIDPSISTDVDGGIGGWIENKVNVENNQLSTCWLDKNSFIFDRAKLEGNAQLKSAILYDKAILSKDSLLSTPVFGNIVIGSGTTELVKVLSKNEKLIKPDLEGIDKWLKDISSLIKKAIAPSTLQKQTKDTSNWQSSVSGKKFKINFVKGKYVSKTFNHPDSKEKQTVWQIIRTDKTKEVGGWIEQASNLDQDGACWIYPNGIVFDDSKLSGEATVGDKDPIANAKDALVYGKAVIGGKSTVAGGAKVVDAKVIDTVVHDGEVLDSKTQRDQDENENENETVARLRKTPYKGDKYDFTGKTETIQNPDFENTEFQSALRTSVKAIKAAANFVGLAPKSYTQKKTITVHQIAKKDTGEIGGWVESKDNLSQDGSCWITPDAKVTGFAKVTGDALILDDAIVHGMANVSGTSIVKGNADVGGFSNMNKGRVTSGVHSAKEGGVMSVISKTGKVAAATVGAGVAAGAALQNKGLLF